MLKDIKQKESKYKLKESPQESARSLAKYFDSIGNKEMTRFFVSLSK